MKKSWSRLFVLSACVLVAFASSANISKQVMERLDKLYEKPTEKLKDFPKPKMITLLGGNADYRQALENTVDSKGRFQEVAYYIIDQELDKSKWTFWGTMDAVAKNPIACVIISSATQWAISKYASDTWSHLQKWAQPIWVYYKGKGDNDLLSKSID